MVHGNVSSLYGVFPCVQHQGGVLVDHASVVVLTVDLAPVFVAKAGVKHAGFWVLDGSGSHEVPSSKQFTVICLGSGV